MLGQAILSNISHFEISDLGKDNVGNLNMTIANKISKFNGYIPFAQKQPCVVMFVNIRNFSILQTEWSDTEELRFALKFSNCIEESVRKNYGIVNGFWGGSALVLFNVLLYERLDVACRRALCAVANLNEEIAKTFEDFSIEVNLGIGSNAGNVFFCGVGLNESCYNYNSFGSEVGKAKKHEYISGRTIWVYDEERFYKTPNEKHTHIMVSKDFFDEINGNHDHHIEKISFPIRLRQSLNIEELYGFTVDKTPNPCASCIKCASSCVSKYNVKENKNG